MATIAPPRPASNVDPDPAKLEQFMNKMVGDMGAAMSGPLVITGVKLGLYRALAEIGPATSQELADNRGLDERYVREWLSAQAASGFADFDPQSESFSLNPEQQMALANEDSPVYVAAGVRVDRVGLHRRAEDHRCLHLGRRGGLARASRMPLPRH